MAINKNHEFEELNGIKCGIVEREVLPGRAAFLKGLLAYNKYTVIVVPSPAPKVVSVAGVAMPQMGDAILPPAAPPPETFTIGVTDVSFNPVNAIFGRLLNTPDGHVVTQAYWHQKEAISHDEIPYYERVTT